MENDRAVMIQGAQGEGKTLAYGEKREPTGSCGAGLIHGYVCRTRCWGVRGAFGPDRGAEAGTGMKSRTGTRAPFSMRRPQPFELSAKCTDQAAAHVRVVA